MTWRYKATVEYIGTPFHGFQYQEGLPTVQDELEKAFTHLNHKQRPKVFVAGRTDAGVHALGQVIHVDLVQKYDLFELQSGINHFLRESSIPKSIAITNIDLVDASFHARFSAKERVYVYRINNRRPHLTFQKNLAWHVPTLLDHQAMHKAAQILVGHHDFTTFRSSECQGSTPMKTLDLLSVERNGDELSILAKSRSFLHHQVRNIVGTLKLVGEGKWCASDIQKALNAKDRKAGGPTAPPDGLYLLHIGY